MVSQAVQYACIAHRITVSCTVMLELVTESCYQSPNTLASLTELIAVLFTDVLASHTES